MEFSKWLENELKARHLSIQGFANKSGLARSTVSKLISGTRDVTAYTAPKIAAGLGVPVSLVLEKAKLVPETEKPYKLHPILESAVSEIAGMDEHKQILAAKLIRVVVEDVG
jgi:transcriptional regulator with XRE-family HTH domain